jgi:hypothetical protein
MVCETLGGDGGSFSRRRFFLFSVGRVNFTNGRAVVAAAWAEGRAMTLGQATE